MMQTVIFYPYLFFKSFRDFREYPIVDREEYKTLHLSSSPNTKTGKYRNRPSPSSLMLLMTS